MSSASNPISSPTLDPIFNLALSEYTKLTGENLVTGSTTLAAEIRRNLEASPSTDDVLDVLWKPFLGAKNHVSKLMESLDTIVNSLHNLSAPPSHGENTSGGVAFVSLGAVGFLLLHLKCHSLGISPHTTRLFGYRSASHSAYIPFICNRFPQLTIPRSSKQLKAPIQTTMPFSKFLNASKCS
jgi:hypothetical protein